MNTDVLKALKDLERTAQLALEVRRLRNINARLARLLTTIVNDYEHCAPDEAGNIDPWRKRLIAKTRATIAAAKGEA